MQLPPRVSDRETMTAYVAKDAAGEILDGWTKEDSLTTVDVSSSSPDSVHDTAVATTDQCDENEADEVMMMTDDRRDSNGKLEHVDQPNEDRASTDSDHQNKNPEELTKLKVEDGPDNMLHFLGQPLADGAGFVGVNQGDLTRERLRQLATARLAEQQGQRAMTEANFLLHREAAAIQQKVNATVATKPLYPIGAPQRVRMPKQSVMRYPDQLQRHSLYDGPLNLINRPIITCQLPMGMPQQTADGPMDLSKPLDLSMKSDRIGNAPIRVAQSIADPRRMIAGPAEMVRSSSSAVLEMASQVTSVQTMYRPPPMMSYVKPGRHGNAVHASQHTVQRHQHSLLPQPKDAPRTIGQQHPLVPTSVGPHIQAVHNALKRPAPVVAQSASGIPLKRAAQDTTLTQAKERLKVAPSSIVPTSMNLKSFQEASRAALLAYERERSHAVALMNQGQDSQIRITDVRSIGPKAATGDHAVPSKQVAAQTRPRGATKTGGVFHHIHHHHHHHHVPTPDEELLRPPAGTNGTPGLPSRAGVPAHPGVITRGAGAVPVNGLPSHEVPIHRLSGHVIPGHDASSSMHGVAVPAIVPHSHGVLIKHAPPPVSTITSPHLRRAHYHTRRRYRNISPPTLASTSAGNTLRRSMASVTSTPGRAHLHARAVSPLKLVASSIAAGAKMNELLKPLDEPDHTPTAIGHKVANNNNNKVLMTDKLARPLRVDIPDDRAFVSHLGGVYSGQANPVPLVRQVSNVASITKCLTSEASSSPKKSNSSGNESPTMPVLTPQSVYSPGFTTDSVTNLSHISSNIETPTTSSPLFYNSALALPLYPRKADVETFKNGQKLPRAAREESPPHLQESPERPDQFHRALGHHTDSERGDRRVERTRVENALQRQIDTYFLDAAAAFDKNKREKIRLREAAVEQRDAYRRYTELCRTPAEIRDKPRKRHTHLYGLKASMDKLKSQQANKVKERKPATVNEDDRNIFAQLMLQRQWYDAKNGAAKTAESAEPDQGDVIDLTTSPAPSPSPDGRPSVATKLCGSGGLGAPKKPDERTYAKSGFAGGLGYSIFSDFGEEKTVSVSEAIDAVFAAQLPILPSFQPHTEQTQQNSKDATLDRGSQLSGRTSRDASDQKDQPPKLVKVQASPLLAPSVSPSVNSCSPNSSSEHTTFLAVNGKNVEYPSTLPSANSSPSFPADSPIKEILRRATSAGDVSQPLFLCTAQGTLPMASSTLSLPHHLRYSPTEKTLSHDPRKKLLAAMSVHTPIPSAVSPASIAASICSTASPSSGRSTPSKSAARKRSLEISRLENTSSFVAEIPKRKQNVDLLTDPSLLDREERALQRAMKRFNEMEKKERVTPTDTQTNPQPHPQPHLKKLPRLLFGKHSPLFRRGGRGRGRKFLNSRRFPLRSQEDAKVFRGAARSHRGISRGTHFLSCQPDRRTSFQDFVPMVLEERTRHSLATRSSARERKAYHKNARYEMEIEKEERKYLERKRQKRSLSGSTSGEEDMTSTRSKLTPGRRRIKGAEDVPKTPTATSDASVVDVKKEPTSPREDAACPPSQSPGTDGAQRNPPSVEASESATSPGLDSPLHVVIDPKNLTKIKLMTSSAYELHRKDTVREGKADAPPVTESEAPKPGGKRKFKTKHLGPTDNTTDTDSRQGEELVVKTEVLDESQMSAPSPPTLSEPSQVKTVRPRPPIGMKRLMVNKKLGETLLHRAARLAYDDVAIYCIDYDVVNINAKDNAGYTPLHECCVHGRLRVALHLLQHGADVNASASDGTRPIHDAVDNNWLALVRLLLMYGADPLIATYSGRSTITLARTTAMKTFIIGYLNDVNGNWERDDDDPYQSNLDLCWHLAGTHSFDANDLPVADIFQDIPEEKIDQTGEFLVELSETPLLNSYNIRLPKDKRVRNWLLLDDVINQLETTRSEFLAGNRHLRCATMTHDEFTVAIKGSQLNCTPPDKSQCLLDNTSGYYVVEILELTSELRTILNIDEEYV